MMPRVLRSKAGFTYIGALVMAVIVGIMASRAAVVWSTAMKREREEELIFRGTQIRDAMRRWYKFRIVDGKPMEPYPAGTPKAPNLQELKSLLQDPNTPGKLRYLRPSALVDPMTGKEWEEIRKDGKIVGVKSKSEQSPLKQGNFPFDLHPEDFEKKKKYSEWQFIYDRVPPPTAMGGGQKNLNGSNPPPIPGSQGTRTEGTPARGTGAATDTSPD